ncbi:hypothetical protein GCM10007420_21930 [Glycocaulis albus]|uniref:SEC-C motif-containing protein n=1 Tax=Glycocaulis albus TaxID=1382801 RepID=A0ABQ1XW16_9PROT|nr:hypothetical protein GCM10007420_21930 [Glycocaulis albus]
MLDFAEFERALAFRQPKLRLRQTGEILVAKGEFVLSDGASLEGRLDAFDIEMLVATSYPEVEPLVREVGGRIPYHPDWHMYANGRCCTCIWEEWCATSADTSFKAFCEGPLRNFFLSQHVFEKTGEWPFGERAHGAAGYLQAAANFLGLDEDDTHADRYLQAVAAQSLKGHWDCPCGSGRRLRDCHYAHFVSLRERVDRNQAIHLLTRLLELRRQERVNFRKPPR